MSHALTGAALQSSLRRDDVAGAIFHIPLAHITANDNPRSEPESLARLGYRLVDPDNPTQSLVHLAVSEDMDQVRLLVMLVEKHEGEPKESDDGGTKVRDARVGTPIMTLARSILDLGLLQPAIVRKGPGSQKQLIFGQRRMAAIAYLHAKSRLANEKKIYPAVIDAREIKADDDLAWELGVQENHSRKANTAFQEAHIVHQYLTRRQPDGKKWTVKALAKHLGMEHSSVRNRHALLIQRQEPVIEDGKVVKSGRGLTDADREDILSGKKTLTWGFRRALGMDYYSPTGLKMSKRAKPITLKQMQTIFDNTDETLLDRRQAIAECMGLTLDQAVTESDARIDRLDRTEVRRRDRSREREVVAEASF